MFTQVYSSLLAKLVCCEFVESAQLNQKRNATVYTARLCWRWKHFRSVNIKTLSCFCAGPWQVIETFSVLRVWPMWLIHG